MANTKTLGQTKTLRLNYPDIRQSPNYGKFMQTLGWRAYQLKELGQGLLRQVPLLPITILKIQRFSHLNGLIDLNQFAKKHHTVLIKLEPLLPASKKLTNQLKKFGFKKDNWPLSPAKTLILNLCPHQQELLKTMRSKTRYNIRLAQRQNLKINISSGLKTNDQQLKEFYNIWKNRRHNISLTTPKFEQLKNLKKAFGSDFYLLTSYKKSLNAGLVLLKYQKTVWYWHNGSTADGRRLFAPTLLTWDAIKLAKTLGCQQLDFEGIYDQRFDRQTKAWQGFSRFKLGFGGQKIPLAGTFSKWSNLFTWL